MAMAEAPAGNGSPSNYKALLAIGRRPVSPLFDERGAFISEVPAARQAARGHPPATQKKPPPLPGTAFSMAKTTRYRAESAVEVAMSAIDQRKSVFRLPLNLGAAIST